MTAWSQGIRAGAFDIQLDSVREVELNGSSRQYAGLRFEFKTLDGTVSDEQKAERIWLDREGYFAHYVFHYVEALALLAFYLNIPTERFVGYPRSRHALRDFAPEKAHDARCGCELKVADLVNF